MRVLRVLRVLTRPNLGGPMRQALALWPQDEAAGQQTLLAVGACGPGETAMDAGALPAVAAGAVTPASGGIVHLSRLGRAARPWRDALAVGELRQLIRRFRPHVVHTHTSQAGFFGRRAARREGVPIVAHTFHGHVLADYYAKPVAALFRHLEARLATTTDLLYAVSGSCRDELHALGVGPGRIEVVPPALDLGPFRAGSRAQARRALGLAEGTFAVAFVGRLVPIKRPEVFVGAVQRCPGAHGFVCGDGPLAAAVRGTSGVTALGPVADVHRLFPGFDALVLSSRREGCPLVALEAFAAGVPVVGLDVPGVRDALADWGAGLLVPSAAGSAGLAAALQRLRREPATRAELVESARRGLARFSAAAVAARLAADYARAVAGATARATARGTARGTAGTGVW